MTTQTTTATTNATNWKNAIKEIRANNIQFRSNLPVCCGSCVTDEDLNMKPTHNGYAFFFGTQGRGFTYDRFDDIAYDKDSTESVDEYIHFGNHGDNPTLTALNIGETITNIFQAHGVKYEWGGTEYETIRLILNDNN